MMPLPGLQICLHLVTLSFGLLTSKVDHFMLYFASHYRGAALLYSHCSVDWCVCAA